MFWKKTQHRSDSEFSALICELIEIKLEGVNFLIDDLRKTCDKRHKETSARLSELRRELKRVKRNRT